MEQRATGLILRTRPLTETSLIVHWLTAASGRVSTVAKGARRPKSPFRGRLDLFFKAQFTFSRSRRSELHTLREISLIEPHLELRRDLAKLRQAAYCSGLIEQTTERDTPLDDFYLLLDGLIDHLTGHPAVPQTVLAFEMKLLACLGQRPSLTRVSLSPGAQTLLERLEAFDWPTIGRLQPSVFQIVEMNRFLHGFLIHQFGTLVPGRAAALNSPPGPSVRSARR